MKTELFQIVVGFKRELIKIYCEGEPVGPWEDNWWLRLTQVGLSINFSTSGLNNNDLNPCNVARRLKAKTRAFKIFNRVSIVAPITKYRLKIHVSTPQMFGPAHHLHQRCAAILDTCKNISFYLGNEDSRSVVMNWQYQQRILESEIYQFLQPSFNRINISLEQSQSTVKQVQWSVAINGIQQPTPCFHSPPRMQKCWSVSNNQATMSLNLLLHSYLTLSLPVNKAFNRKFLLSHSHSLSLFLSI